MANAVYGPESDEKEGYKHPNLGQGDDNAAGNPTDPRGNDVAAGDSSDPRGEGPDKLDGVRDQENNSLYNAEGDNDSSAASSGELNSAEEGESGRFKRSGLYKDYKQNKSVIQSFMNNRRKWAFGGAAIAGVVATLAGIFLSLGSLNLTNFMANIEQKGFMRYQVDMDGRSSKWLQAYMTLRFGEIDDPKIAPRDRDNIIFRSNRVDTNSPMSDWYRTLRASKFEQKVFEARGIRFTSMAYQDGNIVKFRPAILQVKGDSLEFDPRTLGYDKLDALSETDINKLNGRLQDFYDINRLNNDAEARKALKQLTKEMYPQWWRASKRYHLRQDIQNMIGVRKWKFFENKREAVKEDIRSRRNTLVDKFVQQSLPEDSKSGKFISCLFGTSNCTASTDYANPDNRQMAPDGTQKQGDKTSDTNGDGKPDSIDDGSSEGQLKEAAGSSGVARETLSKLFKGANVLSMLDSLARFDQFMHDHKYSKLVGQIKAQYVLGVYTTLKVADDQHKTGEVSSQEFSDFMGQYGNMMNGEGWATVVDPPSSSASASAATITPFAPAKSKAEFCSKDHQELIQTDANRAGAFDEFQYLCPADRVGSDGSNAADIENSWNSVVGSVLHPILNAFHSAAGPIVSIIDSVTGAFTGALLSVTGLADDLTHLIAYAAGQALKFGGANMDMNTYTPPGRVGNLGLEGAGVGQEMSMRDQGAASTTAITRAETVQRIAAYEKDQAKSTGFTERYFALSNPRSAVSRQLLSFGNLSFSQSLRGMFTRLGSVISSPLHILSSPVLATNTNNDGYEVARFAGIETFDMPKQCLDTNPLYMNPADSTNADEMGLFAPEELNWTLMSNKNSWYDALYAKLEQKGHKDDEAMAKQVWNCALFDNMVRGSIGAPFGYKGENAYDPIGIAPSSSPDDTTAISGDSQELAKQVLANKNINLDVGRLVRQDVEAAAKGENGSAGVKTSAAIFKLLLAIADKHSIVPTAIQSGGTGHCNNTPKSGCPNDPHYTGDGIDLGTMDGKFLTGRDPGSLEIIRIAGTVLPKGSGVGQSNCGSANLPDGFITFTDSCNHLHVQVPKGTHDKYI